MEDIHRNGRTGWEGEGGEESSLQVKTLKASYLAYTYKANQFLFHPSK